MLEEREHRGYITHGLMPLQLVSDICKQRRISHHRIRDASEPFNKTGNSGLRVQQGLPFPHHLTGTPEPDTDFRNPVSLRVSAGGFDIQESEGFLLQGTVSGCHREPYAETPTLV